MCGCQSFNHTRATCCWRHEGTSSGDKGLRPYQQVEIRGVWKNYPACHKSEECSVKKVTLNTVLGCWWRKNYVVT